VQVDRLKLLIEDNMIKIKCVPDDAEKCDDVTFGNIIDVEGVEFEGKGFLLGFVELMFVNV
jgi:hypothetical protein